MADEAILEYDNRQVRRCVISVTSRGWQVGKGRLRI